LFCIDAEVTRPAVQHELNSCRAKPGAVGYVIKGIPPSMTPKLASRLPFSQRRACTSRRTVDRFAGIINQAMLFIPVRPTLNLKA
jgi:hypothetical protein